MQPFSPIFWHLLFLLDGLSSRAAPSPGQPVGSDLQGMLQPSGMPTGTLENLTRDQPTPGSSASHPPEHSGTPPSASPHISTKSLREPPSPSPFLSLDTPIPDQLTSVAESQGTSQTSPSKATLAKPSETPKPDPTGISPTESPETPKHNPSNTSPSESPESVYTDPTPTLPHESPEISKRDTPKLSPGEGSKIPSPRPTQFLSSKSPEIYEPSATRNLTSALLPTTHPDPTESPQSVFLTTHNSNPTDVPQTQFPAAPNQNLTEMARTSDLETSSGLSTQPATFRGEATPPSEPGLSPSPGAPAVTRVATPGLSTSDSPGTKELHVPQNSDPKGPDTPLPSARIAGPPALPEHPNQVAAAPQRHSRGDTVNTIIVVERVKETGVTLVSRPRGSVGGALCLFFAGTGLLIGIFLLLWCLYRRASRHRSFAHHRLRDSGEEPVLHLDAPKDPLDLYFYAPDAWVPSHIATQPPPSTPPLPPKLPPPPRGPQRLEALSPAALAPNFV